MAISDAIAAAPIEHFPIDSAPIEKIPIDITPIEKVPIDITPIAKSNAIDIAARLIIPMAIQPKLNTPKEIIPAEVTLYISDNIINFFKSGTDCPVSLS